MTKEQILDKISELRTHDGVKNEAEILALVEVYKVERIATAIEDLTETVRKKLF